MNYGLKEKRIRFGTSGWRGIIGRDFTSSNLALVVQAVAAQLSKGGGEGIVITGYDTRFMSGRFARISANVLRKNNIRVLLCRRDTPTPVIAFHIIKRGAQGAVNITASHNPPEYNGLKFSAASGGPAAEDVTSLIEKEIIRLQKKNTVVEYSAETDGIETFNPVPAYIKHIRRIIDMDLIKRSGIKVAVDCMYGTSRGYLDCILRRCGIPVKVIRDTLNPGFEGMPPNPSPERLGRLKKIVLKNRMHIGLATDGDADRFGIIDADGSFISANYMLSLIFRHLLATRRQAGGIVRSVTTTHLLDAIAERAGREVYETPVGFKYVGQVFAEKKAIMGCEESGGMTVSGHVPEKDGILACLLAAEISAYNKKRPLKEILKGLMNEYGRFYSVRMDIKVTEKRKKDIIGRVKEYAGREMAGIKISGRNIFPGGCIKIYLRDRSWIMVRPSGTEPILRCYIEAVSMKKLKALGTFVKGIKGVTV